ncbi:MAG: right-handed parallel beta-helix repeat-containing protein [Candidatus Glassbacteria bacterium]|nr:right-handed parallel beta-helix repeat-containing protein [Candidatus Glassbacteria bacterium]
MSRLVSIIAALCTVVLCSASGYGDNRTVPGEVTTPFPTITNLAVEWQLEGDDDEDGRVRVWYRQAGGGEWTEGMPLLRIPAGKGRTTQRPFHWENRHSGSLFDLKPDTEYEIKLQLRDPDGGDAEQTVTARTRAVPRPAPDGRVIKVNARNLRDSLLLAMPGDIFELAPGYYGHVTVRRSGQPGRPIVIRSDRSHEVINSTFDSFDFGGQRYVILDGVTVNGSVNLLRARECAVRHCTVNAKYGIIAKSPPGCTNCYVADNIVTYVMPWVPMGMGAGMITGGSGCVGEGIQLTGPGNVICYNRVKGYRDCISFMEDLGTHRQVCIDVYNNDVYVGADDGIEADFAQGNCRIMRNRITNCFMAMTSQPGLGGPTYFIRNVMYNIIDCPYKLSRDTKGDIILHNTVVKVGDGFRVVHNPTRALFRNNLMIGGPGGGRFGRYGSGEGWAVWFPRTGHLCDMDYDGVGAHGFDFKANVGGEKYMSFAAFREATTEKHAVQVDMDVFAADVPFPDPAVPERKPQDLRLRPGSAAVDAGVIIPGINSGFSGKSPDLGALELGGPVPHYGPRPRGVDEQSQWEQD